VHEVSLVDLLDIARLTGTLPARRALVAVQPKTVGWGDCLTAEVEPAMQQVVSRVTELIETWDTEDEP
jgi:hydrogenase maturation protease